MNREIKFRAWRKTSYFDDGTIMEEGEMIKSKLLDSKYNVGFGCEADSDWDLDDYEFMRDTGMKDKNDKEIYEGDIVKVSPDRGKTWDTGEVVYGRFAAFSVFLRDIGTGIKSPLLNFCGSTMCAVPDIFIEVIGNIYENPELLNQEKDE